MKLDFDFEKRECLERSLLGSKGLDWNSLLSSILLKLTDFYFISVSFFLKKSYSVLLCSGMATSSDRISLIEEMLGRLLCGCNIFLIILRVS